ncbi:MAG TPA: ribosome biogenesis factor YjgA [Burkholderiales bacterium]|nr:ribosome biogenesis factor YjgA [Burkholderiales bacterium]
MAGPSEPNPTRPLADQAASKTQRKRESLALQGLGEELTRLTPEQLGQLQLPEHLLEALLEARRISKFGALRRQLQYIGRLMRDVDSAAIAARLRSWKGESRESIAYLHRLERLRARLLEDESAVRELTQSHPGCDTQKLRQLVRNARREQVEGRPPHSFRALFQELRSIVPAEPGAAE